MHLNDKNSIMLKEVVTFLLKQLASHPESVEVQEADMQQGKVLKLIVHKNDVGKVIGKDGQSIKSIRSMVALFKTDQEPIVDVAIDS
jgi:predicted RNA-binding protein YlqC (UPF0109 family)